MTSHQNKPFFDKVMESPSKMPKIIIIGSGIAGIAAANHLISGGLSDILILEAKNRVGGRIQTIQYGSRHLEMGAQWIHGEEENPVYELAAKNNLIADPESSDEEDSVGSLEGPWQMQYFTQGGSHIDPVIVKETCEILDGIFAEADRFSRETILTHQDESIGTFVSETFYKYLRTKESDPETLKIMEAIFNWRLSWEKAENACKSVYEMSAYAWGEYLECKGNESVTLLHGYEPVLDLLLQNIPPSCFKFQVPVQSIHWDPVSVDKIISSIPIHNGAAALKLSSADHLRTKSCDDEILEKDSTGLISTDYKRYPLAVRTKSGEVYLADHVIVTASLGVLKKSAHFMFKPLLPREKMAAIQRMGFGTVDKMYIEWETPWWSKDCRGIQLAWTPDEPFVLDCLEGKEVHDEWYRGLHSFDPVDFQPRLLCGWIAGEEARSMEQLPEHTVLRICHEILVKFTGNANIPEPVRLIRSLWGQEGHVWGSYSYIRVGCTAEDCDILAEPLPSKEGGSAAAARLLFAGEATHRQHFSTVHGALESGQREAQRLLQLYQCQQTPSTGVTHAPHVQQA